MSEEALFSDTHLALLQSYEYNQNWTKKIIKSFLYAIRNCKNKGKRHCEELSLRYPLISFEIGISGTSFGFFPLKLQKHINTIFI